MSGDNRFANTATTGHRYFSNLLLGQAESHLRRRHSLCGMASRTTTSKPRVVLDASAWIAYARGSVPELEAIVEESETLMLSLMFGVIADHYVRHGIDPMPPVLYIHTNAELIEIDERLIDHALEQGLAPNLDGLLRAVASLHNAELISVQDGCLIRSGTGP